MPEYIGDAAEQAANDLRKYHLEEINKGNLVVQEDEDVMKIKKKGIFGKVEFKWRDSDRMLLEQIRAASERMYRDLFSGAHQIIDQLYTQARVAELDDNDLPMKDLQGRVIWKKDERGEVVEDWNQLTGQDIEQALLDLAELRLVISPQVNDLFLEAMFAKRIASDAHDDAYLAVLDGTIGDKGARANRESRQDTYFAFFRYCLWSHGDVFLKELANVQRVLERIRDRRIYGANP